MFAWISFWSQITFYINVMWRFLVKWNDMLLCFVDGTVCSRVCHFLRQQMKQTLYNLVLRHTFQLDFKSPSLIKYTQIPPKTSFARVLWNIFFAFVRIYTVCVHSHFNDSPTNMLLIIVDCYVFVFFYFVVYLFTLIHFEWTLWYRKCIISSDWNGSYGLWVFWVCVSHCLSIFQFRWFINNYQWNEWHWICSPKKKNKLHNFIPMRAAARHFRSSIFIEKSCILKDVIVFILITIWFDCDDE